MSRRLALVEWLPEAIQQQVREGKIAAPVAMKYLVPVARVNAEQCERMAAAFVEHRCDTRQAGQLYAAWRQGSPMARERILAEPELFLKTQRQAPAAQPAALQQVTRDLESFWQKHYPPLRRELGRRYPKHAWPEDPFTAKPQAKGRSTK